MEKFWRAQPSNQQRTIIPITYVYTGMCSSSITVFPAIIHVDLLYRLTLLTIARDIGRNTHTNIIYIINSACVTQGSTVLVARFLTPLIKISCTHGSSRLRYPLRQYYYYILLSWFDCLALPTKTLRELDKCKVLFKLGPLLYRQIVCCDLYALVQLIYVYPRAVVGAGTCLFRTPHDRVGMGQRPSWEFSTQLSWRTLDEFWENAW